MAKEHPHFIAHAGGVYKGILYSNSLEALEYNYTLGVRYFEIDFCWTKDRHLVAIHDWDKSLHRRFGITTGRILTHKEFLGFKQSDNLTQISLEKLIQWIAIHPDAFVITDVKSGNFEALQFIANRYSHHLNNFIPQIYSYDEYEKVSHLGFKNIILTIYKLHLNPPEILSFVLKNKLFAVTMPWEIALQTDLPMQLNNSGTLTYAHTVNSLEKYNLLRAKGVYGIYSDTLLANPE